MSVASATTPNPPVGPRARLTDLIRVTEIDSRLFGMIITLVAIELAFGVYTGGEILAPTNLLTFATQAVQIAIIAAGMVLVIVSRNIDLSVGSVLGVVAMTYAVLMHEIYPTTIGVDTWYGWILALGVGLSVGALLGGFQGFIIAYIGVPSFVVTLGGLLAFRGLVFDISGGSTQAPDDNLFQTLGGGATGSLGGTVSWIVGVVICAAVVGYMVYGRRQRHRFGFATRPRWAEVLIGLVGCLVVLGAVALSNAYHWPAGLVAQYAKAHNVDPTGLVIEAGIPWPAIILLCVTVVMTFIATRRRFGRYVFAIGGNPEAAELGGINTRWTIMKVYILMGVLCAISAAISSAQINGATNDLGSGYELLVISAVVIGGTSFAGGVGTIPGAILGAMVIYALRYNLQYIGMPSSNQDIVIAIVLIVAVGFDTYNRRRIT
ncbi:MAG: sugar ABC transporter permease [Candidatus Limnocylindrales bacterium]